MCARIEELDLAQRFDAALLASNLFTVEEPHRRAFLSTCRRHAPLVVVETLPLGWQPENGAVSALGRVEARLRVERSEAGVVHGQVDYEANGKSWTHPFAMHVFADEAELDAALAAGGFRLERWLERERGWFVAASL